MKESFRIGEWVIDPRSGQFTSSDGIIRIKPMLMRLLAYLAMNAGVVISKKNLIEDVWKQSHVTDDALTHAVSELRKIFGDDARRPKIIETIPKRGYQLIAPVEWSGEVRGFDEGCLRYAVLAFENFSEKDNRTFFGETMTDILITEFAKIPSIRVVSATSILYCRGSRKSLPQIARELDADLLLEGAVVEARGRVRITVRLLDAADQAIWADSYDHSLSDVLELQGKLAAVIVEEVLRCSSRNRKISEPL